MKRSTSALLLSLLLILMLAPLHAGKYYALCEGNFGQANASLWSIDESLQSINGPLIWNAASNPLGDVGQSLTLFDHTLYIVMNGSHEVRVIDLEAGENHIADIEIPDSSPRFMAIHRDSGLGYISSWNLGALLVVNLENNAIIDTFFIGGLPEQLLIVGNEMFVTVPMKNDWTASNKLLRIDLSGNSPEIIHTYDVIDGPGAMALIEDRLYVTSIYYNDAWETFSGTSVINLTDNTVNTLDHGYYTNYTADINIIEGTVYRTFGPSIVPLNEDLSLNLEGALGDMSGIYCHSVANNHILVGTSDFVAPDLVSILSLSGQELASFNVGALPSQIVYYSPDLVATEPLAQVPSSLSLENNYPNPFNPETTIRFQLAHSEPVQLNIYDIMGHLVVQLHDGPMSPGNHAMSWNGINQNGQSVDSGIYWAVLSSGSEQTSIRMTLLR